MSAPDHPALVRVGEPIQGAVRADGPVVVVTAMSLSPVAREALALRLGPGHIVRDIRDAGDTAHVVLVPAVSGQLVGALREMYPGAKILVTELSDAEFGLDLPGPVSRVLRSGVDGYFVAPDLGQLAAVTREAARGVSVAALTTGRPSSSPGELEAQDQQQRRAAVLRLAPARASGYHQEAGCWDLDLDAWVEQLHPDGAGPADRLRCVELAWTTARQVLEGGLDVRVAGADHEIWRQWAHRSRIDVIDQR